MRMSVFERLGKDELQKMVNESSSFLDVMRKCKLSVKGTGNYTTLRKFLEQWNIDVSLINSNRQKHLSSLITSKKTIPLSELLVKGHRKGDSRLKSRLIKAGILKEVCQKCKCDPVWQGEKLVLQLDHVNGNNCDNSVENLRLLCPNCHTQTHNFSGRKLKKLKKKHFCGCGQEKSEPSNQCIRCRMFGTRKVVRPIKEVLEKEIQEHTMVSLGKKYGVSDVAVHKWCKYYGIK